MDEIYEIITKAEVINGIEFTFVLSAIVEYNPVDDGLYEPEMLQEIYEHLENGTWTYFCAKLSCLVKGIELSTDYLGCCIYKDLNDFIDNSGYYEDMKSNCIKQAIEAIKSLQTIKV